MNSPKANRVRPPWHALLVFVGPALVIYLGLMIVPIANAVRLAFYRETPDGSQVWAGLANIERLFHDLTGAGIDHQFLNALGNTSYFFALVILVQTPVALGLAALLSIRGVSGASVSHDLLFAGELSLVITGWIWTLMFNPTWGVIYSMARSVGVAPPGGWLGIPSTALTAVALVAVWQFAGMPMILFLAAFLGIDDEVIDAAHIDGASGWQTFWQVRLPLILPTVGLVRHPHLHGDFRRLRHRVRHGGSDRGPRLCDGRARNPVLPSLFRQDWRAARSCDGNDDRSGDLRHRLHGRAPLSDRGSPPSRAREMTGSPSARLLTYAALVAYVFVAPLPPPSLAEPSSTRTSSNSTASSGLSLDSRRRQVRRATRLFLAPTSSTILRTACS